MEKIWYILIGDQKQGPLSITQLCTHPKLTPDTLVWRQGFTRWIPARDVPELKNAFKDFKPLENDEENVEPKVAKGDEVILEMQTDPSQFYFWMLIALVLIVYLLYIWRH